MLESCKHTITQGREGEKGFWCSACGAKVYEVESRKCNGCNRSVKVVGGWICNRHMMAISPDMRVTYKISEGTCWTPSEDSGKEK